MNKQKIIHRTAKKIYKAGLFHSIQVGSETLTYRHHDRKFSLQFLPGVEIRWNV